MKARFIVLLSAVMLGSGAYAQDCTTTAALAYDDAKAKNYDAAYEPLMTVKKDCPDYSLATFQYLERVLKYKIENASGDEKTKYINELVDTYKERLQNYPEKTKKGDVYTDIALLKFTHKIGSTEERWEAFDKAYVEDKENFTSPKGLYAYFDLMVNMQDSGDRELQDVFDIYDRVMSKIDEEEIYEAERLQSLIEKQDAGEDLTSKEQKTAQIAEQRLTNFNAVKGALNTKLGVRADCDNLVPIYEKDFEAKKEDVAWLKNANARLSAKDCEDPLFFKISEALHELEPSAASAYSLGQLAEADGERAKALEYYNEAAELEEDPADKAKIYYRIGKNYQNSGSFSQARNFYKKTVNAKPSYGRAYLNIASMYAESANSCGDNAFNKRAVYWLAAEYVAKAGRVDPSLSKHANATVAAYNGRAPQKADVFQEGKKAGEAIQIGCWIGETVRIPQL
ncbi:hypothetical protein [Zunongwangia endophytica]|uniref:Tetratricopeptide repeat-containing protein n=1 Tax=Zunongwangia endophytica TaxID=1808945 RepID=A0ABV8HC31_9FLAO|nr:hypothetical protein [Zunongwangia endophytica]MDN3596324.1 hypothetical protein [Zunongwangia endophytica]